MTPATDPFDDLRDDLVRAAARDVVPAPTRPRRRRRRRTLTAAASAALLVGAIVVSTDLDQDGVDVVAAAAAALDPAGDVVHLVLDGGPVSPSGRPQREGLSVDGRSTLGIFSRRSEQWSTAEPLRFRSTRRLTVPGSRRTETTDFGITGDGRTWTDRSFDRAPADVRTVRSVAPRGDVSASGVLRSADPAAGLRRALRAGGFRDTGVVTIDGRPSRRLVADLPGRAGPRGGSNLDRRLVYLVDPDTFAPRRYDVLVRAPAGTARPGRYAEFRPWESYVVRTYERLPLDAATRRLFRVPGGR